MKFLKKYAPLGGLLLAVTVQAQTAPPPAPKSPADMHLRIEEIKKQIAEDTQHVIHLQAITRKDKDVIKLTCVNDKMVQIKAQANVFDNANLQLEASLTNSDTAGATTSFDEAEKAGADVKKLRDEADACAGELEMYKQESNTDVERPPDLDDPTDYPGFDVGVGQPDVEPPGFATPWK